MRILIVSKAFHPQNNPRSFRTTELATELVRQGHDVTVAVPVDRDGYYEYCHQNSIKLIDLGKPKWKEMEIEGSGVVRFLKRAIRRGAIQLLEYPDIEITFQINKRLRDLRKFDLAITIAAPHAVHWGFRYLLSKNKDLCKTWIADCGDPYYGQRNDSFNKWFYFKQLERWCFNRADFITVPIDDARPAYLPEHQQRIRTIPQGFSFPELSATRLLSEELGHPVFCYSGSVSPYRDIAREFANALNLSDTSFTFFIICNSENRIFWESLLSEKSRAKVKFLDYMPRLELIPFLSRMNFLVHFPYKDPTQKSLKLVDYHYVKRPILSSCSEESCGLFNDFLQGIYENSLPAEDIDKFRIENVASSFLKLVDR